MIDGVSCENAASIYVRVSVCVSVWLADLLPLSASSAVKIPRQTLFDRLEWGFDKSDTAVSTPPKNRWKAVVWFII